MTLHVPDVQSRRPSRLQRARRAVVHWLRGTRMGLQSLRTNLAILKAQQEATLDGILVVDIDGRILSYNRRFLEIWGIPPEAAKTSDDRALLRYAEERVSDWESFIAYAREHPGKLNYGMVGRGSAQEILALELAKLTGIRMTGVPYKGVENTAVTDSFPTEINGLVHVAGGNVVMTDKFFMRGCLVTDGTISTSGTRYGGLK